MAEGEADLMCMERKNCLDFVSALRTNSGSIVLELPFVTHSVLQRGGGKAMQYRHADLVGQRHGTGALRMCAGHSLNSNGGKEGNLDAQTRTRVVTDTDRAAADGGRGVSEGRWMVTDSMTSQRLVPVPL